MIEISNLVSHKDYFKLFPNEIPHYSEYTKPRVHNPKSKFVYFKVIAHGFIKWEDEDASIWGGPFPGNYCLMELKKYKSHQLKSMSEIEEENINIDLKYFQRLVEPRHANFMPSKEKPYSISLYGNDDASYSKVFESKIQALQTITNLMSNPTNINLIDSLKFNFTN